MNLFYHHPSSIYFEFPPYNPVLNYRYNVLNVYIIRNTESKTETKLLNPRNQNYYFPYDLEFLRDNYFKIYLRKLDGSYQSQLLVKKDDQGRRLGYPLQTKFKNGAYSSLLLSQDFQDLITADGQYTIFSSSVGRTATGTSSIPSRSTVLTEMNKNNVLCVLTKAEDYGKQLGACIESGGSNRICNFLNGIKFLHSTSGVFGTQFINPETDVREFEIISSDNIDDRYSKCCYEAVGNKLVWQSSETPPPDGYDLEYDLHAEQWYLKQSWNSTNSQLIRIPPWEGTQAEYLINYTYEQNTKLQALCKLEYSQDEKKWVIKNNQGVILYENTSADGGYFDSTQTYHFDFVGELSEEDDERIADGLDLVFYREISLFGSSSYLYNFFSGDTLERAKEEVRNYKYKTGFKDNFIFDQPYFS